jgi:hypothetical protein
MTFLRRRWMTAVSTSVLLVLAACSSARTTGNGPDAPIADDGDGGSGDGDAATDDGNPGDGATIDGANVDAPGIDAPGIDAPGIDAAIDAVPIDAPIDAPIDSNGCTMQPCDYQAPQCGCAAPLVCDIDFTDLIGSSCRAVNAPGTTTSNCGSFSECAGGHTCVMAGGGQRCERFCTMDSQCDQPRGKCIIQINNQMGQPVVGATTCSSGCNPLATTNGGLCPANWKCGFFTIGTTDIVDCALPGGGIHGTVCNTDADCGAGTMCSTVTFNGVTTKKCRRVCNKTGGGQECAQVAGTTCLGFGVGNELVVGGTEYGICAP